MRDESFALLKRIVDTPGPSGYEQAVQRVYREEAAKYADEVRTDVLGNVIAVRSYLRSLPTQYADLQKPGAEEFVAALTRPLSRCSPGAAHCLRSRGFAARHLSFRGRAGFERARPRNVTRSGSLGGTEEIYPVGSLA